ncbi:MAG: PEP-CTERM sorting domain-containing protein [Planctomycetota bacterium]
MQTFRFKPRPVALLSVLVLCLQPASARAVEHSLLFDRDTVYPGIGQFVQFQEVAFDGSNVAMIATSTLHPDGAVFFYDGTDLTTVADTATAAPDLGSNTFEIFRNLAMDDGNIAFHAYSTGFNEGIYTTLGGSLRRVADKTDFMPGTNIPYYSFSDARSGLAIDGDNIVFTGEGRYINSVNRGVFQLQSSGLITTVADLSTVIPDYDAEDNQFVFFNEVDVSEGEVVFNGGRGSGGGNGTYTNQGGTLRTVKNEGTALPGITPPQRLYNYEAQISGGVVPFHAQDQNRNAGLYLDDGGVITTVVNANTVYPETGQTFGSVGLPFRYDNGRFLFSGGVEDGPAGLFATDGTEFRHLLERGQDFDGKSLLYYSVWRDSVAGNQLVAQITYDDYSRGIYLIDWWSIEPGLFTVKPLVDGDVDWNGSAFEVTTDGNTLVAQDYPAAGDDERILLAYEVGGEVPEGMRVSRATLTIDPSLISSSGDEYPTLSLFAYAGDATLTASDAIDGTLVGTSDPVTGLDPFTIELDTHTINAIVLGGADVLGLTGRAADNGHQIGLNSTELEALVGEDAPAPVLTIEYDWMVMGDLNGDGTVDQGDISAFVLALIDEQGFESAHPFIDRHEFGDFNGDGVMDNLDILGFINLLSEGNEQQAQSIATSITDEIAGVPEPTMLVLLGLGGLMLLRRRG